MALVASSVALCCSVSGCKLSSFCVLTLVAPGVVFHRLYHEREVGSKLPFPRRIREPQPVRVLLSYVHPELQLQRGRRLLHHGDNHHLHDRARWEDGWQLNNCRQSIYPLVSLHPLPVYSPTGGSLRQDMMGGTVHTSEVIMRKRSENRAYTDEHIRDSIVMGDMSKFPALGESALPLWSKTVFSVCFWLIFPKQCWQNSLSSKRNCHKQCHAPLKLCCMCVKGTKLPKSSNCCFKSQCYQNEN